MRNYPNPLVARAAAIWFGARLSWYRLRYPRSTFGAGVRIVGRLRIGKGTRVELGRSVRIRQKVVLNGGGTIVVGEHTLLNGCWIQALERVDVGAWSLLSDCGVTDTDHHNLTPRLRHAGALPQVTEPVVLGRNVWVGLGAVLLKGTTVGEDSVVGAGAVVRGRVPDGVVVIGNPAEIVKEFGPDERATGTSELAD
jgi:acetyltransferase-like isoleucine patch superfamily enzyme